MSRKRLRVALVAAMATSALAVAVPSASAGEQSSAPCPTFQVLHNDRIGSVVLPAGTYNISGLSGGIDCTTAATFFARFLQDYDGVLPHHWRAISRGSGKADFRRPGKSFSVDRAGSPTGGGSSGRSGSLCGNFHVLHDDHIGPLVFRAGIYQIYVPNHSVLPCGKATNLFSHFLSLPNGRLPGQWRLKRQRAVFYKANQPKQRRFRVDPGT
jgi:hypothetical protein